MAAVDNNVDPALWPLVEAFPPIDVSAETLIGFRAAMVQLSVIPDPASHADVRVETVHIAGSEEGQTLRCLLFKPAQHASAGALLHIHGGGFVMGLPEMDAARNIELVRATRCTILSVDYRLAPEHPHPAGLKDCLAALAWLASQLRSFGIPRERIGVIGESAGGGLAAAVALQARGGPTRRSDSSSLSPGDAYSAPSRPAIEGLPSLACQVLIYPMLMPPAQSMDAPRTGKHIWTRASNGYCWSANLSGPAAADPTTIAGLAPDVTGLPPTFIAVGDLDLFVQDNLAYASRLLAAGSSVEAHVYPGAIHGFDRMVDAPVSQRFTRELVGFIQRHLKA